MTIARGNDNLALQTHTSDADFQLHMSFMFVLCLNLFLMSNAKQFVTLMSNAKEFVTGNQVLPGIVWEGQHVWVFPILAFDGELHLVS